MKRNKILTSLLALLIAASCNVASARYLTSDPIGLEGGVNIYGYANQNPLLFVDENGLAPGPAVGWIEHPGEEPTLKEQDACGCFAKAIGIETLVASGLVGGSFPIIPKRFVTPGSTSGTSPLSQGLSRAFPQKLPMSVPAPTLQHPLSTTNVLGRAMGRWAPVVGWGLLVHDADEYLDCIERCDNCETR